MSVNIKPEDVSHALFDGFFPMVPFDAEPAKGARAGLQEMGLPYVSDAAISKHLAAFVRQHIHDFEKENPTASTQRRCDPLQRRRVPTGSAARSRVIDVMRPWFTTPKKGWEPLVLTEPVAGPGGGVGRGVLRVAEALRRSAHRRRHSRVRTTSRSKPTRPAAGFTRTAFRCCASCRDACRRGEEVHMPSPVLELAARPTGVVPAVHVHRSRRRQTGSGAASAGRIAHATAAAAHDPRAAANAPVSSTCRSRSRRSVPKSARSELYCESKKATAGGWSSTSATCVASLRRTMTEDEAKGAVIDVFPEEKVQAAGTLIARGVWQREEESTTGEMPAGPGGHDVRFAEVARLPALERRGTKWPTGLCRRLWEFLEENAAGRGKSPAHLARWYNLTGLRASLPEFGDPVDRYRVECAVEAHHGRRERHRTGERSPPCPKAARDYWIMWRRISGGLNTALQQQLFTRLKPALLPAEGKTVLTAAQRTSTREMWRAAASLERLDAKTKETLGAAVLRECKKSPVPTYGFWSLTRLGGSRATVWPLELRRSP